MNKGNKLDRVARWMRLKQLRGMRRDVRIDDCARLLAETTEGRILDIAFNFRDIARPFKRAVILPILTYCQEWTR